MIDGETGDIVAECAYDAYGNFTIINATGLQKLVKLLKMYSSPLLYRGYVSTALGGQVSYYLGSRYYIPKYGRFLNADKHFDTRTSIIGSNMFAYCNNNPVMYVDPMGEVPVSFIIYAVMFGVILYTGAYSFMLCLRLYQWGFTHRAKDKVYDMSYRWKSMITQRLKDSFVIKQAIEQKNSGDE